MIYETNYRSYVRVIYTSTATNIADIERQVRGMLLSHATQHSCIVLSSTCGDTKNQGDSSPKPNILIELFQALERKKSELAWNRASGGINILRLANFLHSDTLDASNNMSDTSDGDRLVPALHHTPLLPFLLLHGLRQIRCTS